MSYPVDGVGAHVPTYTPPPQNDPAQTAQHVLDTGARSFRTDDYDARMVELAKELSKGDAHFRRQVMTEIMKRDPDALRSWLTPERANAMRAGGRITLDEEGSVASGFASAYSHGDFGSYQQNVGVDPKKGGDLTIKASALDSWLGGYPTTAGNNLENAQHARQFLDFINTSNAPDVAEFRQEYGKHLLDTYVVNSGYRAQNQERSDAAAGIAANLLGGDSNHPEIAVDVLSDSKYKPDDVKTIMEAAARSNNLYSQDAIRNAAEQRHLNARDNSVPNGSALLFDAVALSKSPKADQLALQFASLPTSSKDMFDPHLGSGGKNNVDGLTLALNGHAKFVFDKLAVYNDDTVPGGERQYVLNASQLGTLFKTTLFNPDSTYRNMLQDTITQYAGAQENAIAQPGLNKNEADHLTVLAAGLTDGVRQGYADDAKARAAQKELLGMVVDIALAGLPAGKWVNGAVEKSLKAAFPDSQKLQDVLNGLSGKLVDTSQSKLTGEAKKAIVDALGARAGNLEIARNTANDLKNSFFNAIDDQTPEKANMQTRYNEILDAVAIARK